MIRIREISLPFDHRPDDLIRHIITLLKIDKQNLQTITIIRKSLDARRKSSLMSVYIVDIQLQNESELLASLNNPNITIAPGQTYKMPISIDSQPTAPVVVGSGPCGLFAALILAQTGHKPILIDRGKDITLRVKDVNTFWKTGRLDSESNVQFGAGGAGTFSDGKLTTQIKDKNNRVRKVLEEFVKAGAPREILYHAKPHIGTDNLIKIVKNVTNTIIKLGGQVRFQTRLTAIETKTNKVTAAIVNDSEQIETSVIVLALGHSARDTFAMLHQMNLPIQPRPFSIGIRVEHPQSLINHAQYGKHFANHPLLPAAEYKLVYHAKNNRSAYTFCMCPGGKVIASASEPGRLVTNGMSFYARNHTNANSALLVGVTPADFNSDSPLAGIEFQRKWEQKTFETGGANYFAPVQLLGDFLMGKPSTKLGHLTPTYAPGTTLCDLADCLPPFVTETIRQAIPQLDKKLCGFATHDAILTAIESRSASPIRILRDKTFQSPTCKGIYPAGEGAGYAGGIISSAVDGIKIAEVIVNFRS